MKKRQPNQTSFKKGGEQPSPEAKSNGQLQKRQQQNIRMCLETELLARYAPRIAAERAIEKAQNGDLDIMFSNHGLKEQLSNGLHNVDVFTDLVNQIEKGKQHPLSGNNKPNDPREFYYIKNKFKNKDMEYQILKDKYGNRFHFAKDISPKKK